ncbi:hypothetical protein C5167_051057 [Papaver somniferum]|uniref:Aminotransferase class I/classII large domain-containing protein n=1 Tax=Papaver somniferum TaxID=3469 RepID=A0A4Y7KUF3_PAPSO|nr:hypothetical protein C5167_051057 [Papaver somniferum]
MVEGYKDEKKMVNEADGAAVDRRRMKRTIYIPRPTWGNHPKVFSIAGLAVEYYRYYEPNTRGLDFQG